MKSTTPNIDSVRYNSITGRLSRSDFDPDTGERSLVEIPLPVRFVADFGTLEVGWGAFGTNGLDFRGVPEGQPIPVQPLDKDEAGSLKYEPMFSLKLAGKALHGVRAWKSLGKLVNDAVEELYRKFQAAPEAQQGKVPIVEMTTTPVKTGFGARQRTLYKPCLSIIGWTDRTPEMGERTVAPPKPAAGGNNAAISDDDIPF